MGIPCKQYFVAGAFASSEDPWRGGCNRLLIIAGLLVVAVTLRKVGIAPRAFGKVRACAFPGGWWQWVSLGCRVFWSGDPLGNWGHRDLEWWQAMPNSRV